MKIIATEAGLLIGDDDGFVIPLTDSDGFLADEDMLSWESQVVQYPLDGEPGIEYSEGDVDQEYTVDCLLWRDDFGRVRGILNYYAHDFKPWERAGNLNIFVDPTYRRSGVATELLEEASRREYSVNIGRLHYTRAGKALARKFLGVMTPPMTDPSWTDAP